MKLWSCLLLFAALIVLFGVLPSVQGQTKEDAAHEELRGLMKEVLTAYNKGDLDALVAALDDDVVVTWQNGKVNKGREEVKAYYEEMTKGPNRVVEKSSINPVPDKLSILYNDSKTAVAWGSSKDHYKLTDGTEFNQETRWSATVVKKDGKWKVVSVHISANMFDNPILHMAIKKTGIWIGSIAGGGGLLVGLVVGANLPQSGETGSVNRGAGFQPAVANHGRLEACPIPSRTKMNPAIPEAELLSQAADWLGSRQLDAGGLRQLARERGLDFATAVLYHALRRSPRNGPLIARLEKPAQNTAALDAEIVVVPGAFYKEKPDTGADGRIIIESARRMGITTVIVPLHSFGTVADNAALLADWLRQRSNRPVVLVSHSKGTTEIRHLLARPDAADLFRQVHAWIDLSGLFLGSPIIGWLRRHRVNWWLVRLLFWWKGFAFSALNEIDRDACPPWPGALDAAPHVDVIHVVGFPLERHLTVPIVRRGYRRLSPLGPNDGTVLLEDVFVLPGRVYPVWGADHYLRPGGRDMSQLVAGILSYLGDSATVSHAKELV